MSFFTGRLLKKTTNCNSGWSQYLKDWVVGADYTVDNIGSSVDAALKYSAFFGCNRVLAETYASVPIKEHQKRDDGGRDETNDTGLYDLLHNSPNENMSAFNYHEQLMYQMNIGGNAISTIKRNRFKEVVELTPYQWHEVGICQDQTTKKIKYTFFNNNELPKSSVFHVAGPSLNGVIGLSPLEYAASAIKLGLTYEKFGLNFYKNGAISSGIFEHPGSLNDEAYSRLKESLKSEWTGVKNVGTPILVEDGLKFNQLSVKPIDAELLASKKFQVEDLCRFYRVPLHLVMHLDRATNNNIEHQSLEFVMYTMLPIFKRVESCVNQQLLTREQRNLGYYFEFNLSGLLRGDQKSMAEAFAVGRQWGWLSVNDIRRLLNMNPIPNGDIYLQPMNMIEAGTVMSDEIKKEAENMAKLIESRGK